MGNTLNKAERTSIGWLLVSKTFERLAFYLLLSILMNYMMSKVQPGVKNTGLQFGFFMVALAITSFFSGILGDRYNRKKIVIIGFILLTVMYLVIPFLPGVSLLLTIVFVLLGIGIALTIPNMIVLLGNIYDEKGNESRRLSGFILFIFAAQLGGFLAPLIASFLKTHWGYTSIFLLAATCGLVSLLFFIQFTRSSRNPDTASAQQTHPSFVSWRKQDNVILLSVLITALVTWFSLQLRGTTLVTALKDLTERGSELSSMLVPMEKYLLPLIMLLFAWWVSRNKTMHWGRIFCIMLVGLAFAITGYLTIAGFTSLKEIIQDKIVIYLFYSFLLIAESLLAPTFLYAVYRSSPPKHKGLFQGIYHLVIAVSTSLFFLGRSLYEIMGSGMFALIAGLLLIGAVVLLWVRKSVV